MKAIMILSFLSSSLFNLIFSFEFKGLSPTNLNIQYSDSVVTLNWDSVPLVQKYYVYIKDNPNGPVSLIDSTSLNNWTGNFSEDKFFFEVTSFAPASPDGFVFIPGGTFMMGDHFNEGDADELPVHNVKVSDFYMCATKVTQKEWFDVIGTNPASGNGVGDDYPIYHLNWYQLLVYCNLRSIAEGLTPCYTILGSTDPADWGLVPTSYFNIYWDAVICDWNANGYRLPTEAEWEYAARGGLEGQRFPNGSTISHSGNGDSQANYYSKWEWGVAVYSYDVSLNEFYHPDYYRSTSPVKTFPPNGYGLYDMSGNIFDWCWDPYDYNDYYYSVCNDQGTVVDPKGPTTGSYHIGRGGWWDYYANSCRIANRNNFVAFNVYPTIVGFRIVRSRL